MKEIREMRNDVIKSAPSIPAADFARFGERAAKAQRAGADRIHIDVISRMIEQMKRDCELGVDGGIDEATAPLVVAAGANVLVAGSSIFATSQGVEAAMESLRAAFAQVAH